MEIKEGSELHGKSQNPGGALAQPARHPDPMIERLYQALWSRIGGRPWTSIIRDSQRKHPLLWLLTAQAIGIILGHLFW